MTGLLTKLDRPLQRARGRYDPDVLLDLPFVPAASIHPFRGTATTFARASVDHCFDSLGVLREVAVDVPCFAHDLAAGTPLGVRIEDQATNGIRNNTMAGASAATDSLPTNWVLVSGAWSSIMDVTNVGVEAGLDFIELRFNGDPGGVTTDLEIESPNIIAAANGQTWTGSVFLKLTGGDLTNVDNIVVRLEERDGSGNFLAGDGSAALPTADLRRLRHTRLLNNASTAFVQPQLRFQHTSGSVDFTMRIYLPQCEQGRYPTAPIKTSGSAATRSRAQLSGTLPDVGGEGALKLVAVAPDGVDAAEDKIVARLDDGTASTNLIAVTRRTDRTVRLEIEGSNGGPKTATTIGTWADAGDAVVRIGWSQSENRAQISLDGATPVEVAWTDDMNAALSRLFLGSDHTFAKYFGGSVKNLRLFGSAVFDVALQGL